MLSYIHSFHAGNYADILKHICLTLILEHLNEKTKPYTFFDTHSGSGLYRYDDENAQKTLEAEKGIKRLLEYEKNNFEKTPDEAKTYIEIVKKYEKENLYPGSPILEKNLIQENCELHLSELHPGQFDLLKNNIENDDEINRAKCHFHIHKRNGFEMLNALTPPALRRGGVLIDPSYEDLEEYEEVVKAVENVTKKWQGAVVAIWYPLLSYRENVLEKMKQKITEATHATNKNTEIADITFCVSDKTETDRMFGSGMFVLNPTWKLAEKMEKVVEWMKCGIL